MIQRASIRLSITLTLAKQITITTTNTYIYIYIYIMEPHAPRSFTQFHGTRMDMYVYIYIYIYIYIHTYYIYIYIYVMEAVGQLMTWGGGAQRHINGVVSKNNKYNNFGFGGIKRPF